jgi:hypothetical protein
VLVPVSFFPYADRRMAFLDGLRRLSRRLSRSQVQADVERKDHPASPAIQAPASFGFSGEPGEQSIASMNAEELLTWENRGIRNIDHGSTVTDQRSDQRSWINSIIDKASLLL